MNVIAHFRAAVVAVAALLTTPQQTPQAFEVVVIHPNRTGERNTQLDLSRPGQFIAVNATARTLLRNAYGLLPFQLAGAPNWDDEDTFDIRAKIDSPDVITQAQFKVLLQSLLADRFHLKAHWETRESPVYVLIRDKGQPKVTLHTDSPDHGMNTQKTATTVHMKGSGVPMQELATNLANQLGRYVIDQTDLKENYDFVLNWSPDQNSDTNLPSLFTAIREQLGLRLEAQKGPMPVLVVDHIEKPSDN
jgi:uncharacterized protein (TIGR03435 family)